MREMGGRGLISMCAGDRSSSSDNSTDTIIVPDMSGPGVDSVDGMGNTYVGTVGR